MKLLGLNCGLDYDPNITVFAIGSKTADGVGANVKKCKCFQMTGVLFHLPPYVDTGRLSWWSSIGLLSGEEDEEFGSRGYDFEPAI